MTKSIKKIHSPTFRAKVALEALLQHRTMAEIASEYGIHPTQITKWKNYLKEHIEELFVDKRKKDQKAEDQQKLIESLYHQIGKITVERDWIKKKSEQFSS